MWRSKKENHYRDKVFATYHANEHLLIRLPYSHVIVTNACGYLDSIYMLSCKKAEMHRSSHLILRSVSQAESPNRRGASVFGLANPRGPRIAGQSETRFDTVSGPSLSHSPNRLNHRTDFLGK
uniref:Uncharacterized protein n=1 Tax=Oryza punctata TaxID=4537 RepID=A0A0E0K2M5_ORYPU